MLRILLTIVLCLLSMPGLAQEYNASVRIITDMNKLPAIQNPYYERAEKILSRRVIDNKDRVVGEVQDVIFLRNGGLKSVKVDFNRLNLSQPVYINFREVNMRAASRTYQLGLEDDQISPLYAQLLADIETAAGPGSEEYSLTKTLEAPVKTSNGTTIGKISDILFSSDGDRVEAIAVRMADGVLNGQLVAVPVSSITLTNGESNVSASVTDDVAKAMNEFALKNK